MVRNMLFAAVVLAAALAAADAADPWKNLTKAKDGLPGDQVQFVEGDEDGNIWVGTLSGLGRISGGKISVINGPGGKPLKMRVWDVLRVGKGKYWIAGDGGAIFLDGGKLTYHLRGRTVAQILRFGAKTLMAKVNEGVVTYDGKEWKSVEFFKGKTVEILTPASDGTVWITVEANGVFALHPAKNKGQPVHHLRGTSVKVVMEDSKKRVWCGMWGKGVMVYDGTAWVRHLKKEKSYILNMQEDARGSIWVATSAHGLYRYDGKEWVNDLREEGSINMLAATSDGKVWISTQQQGGLRYWDGKTWHVSLDSVLPMRCILETTDKTLWAGGVLDGLHVKKAS